MSHHVNRSLLFTKSSTLLLLVHHEILSVGRLGQGLTRSGGPEEGGGGDQVPLPAPAPLLPSHEGIKFPHVIEIPEPYKLTSTGSFEWNMNVSIVAHFGVCVYSPICKF